MFCLIPNKEQNPLSLRERAGERVLRDCINLEIEIGT